jgi:hypothetical protein
MGRLLTKDNPLLVLPSLASTIGLNEAIILQQIHYWLDPNINKHHKDGKYWVYNTYSQWKIQFPFWSEITIRRAIKSLEKRGLIISRIFCKNSYTKIKWYTIDYSMVNELNLELIDTLKSAKSSTKSTDHFVSTTRSDRSEDPINLISSYIETKTTSKNTKNNSLNQNQEFNSEITLSSKKPLDFEREKEMINIWNRVVKKGETITQPTEERLFKLRQILNNHFENNLDNWLIFCKRITSSKFLMGEAKGSSFKASLDWSIKSTIILKIQEGEYGIGDRKVEEANYSADFYNKNGSDSLSVMDSSKCNTLDPTWKKVASTIRSRVGEESFKSWISKLKYEEISGDMVKFKVPTKFCKEWIDRNYSEKILECFKINSLDVKSISLAL